METRPSVLVIVMEKVPAIDSTGLRALRGVVRGARKQGTHVVLSGVHAQPMAALGRSELLDEIGDDNLCGRLPEALERARAVMGAAM